MTPEQYKDSVATGKLQLDWRDKRTHYLIVAFLLLPPVFVTPFLIYDYFQKISSPLEDNSLLIISIPTALGFLFYWIQKSRLEFQIINTSLGREELLNLINQVSEELKWVPSYYKKDIFIAKTEPGFFSGGWGERITILFDKQNIMINSICDPDKRHSVTSMGRNSENENTLIEKIKAADPTAVVITT